MTIIVFDTETTGLLLPMATDVSLQPYLLEFHGIKIGRDFNVIETLTFRCKPPIPIPEGASKVNGIYDKDVMNEMPFASKFMELSYFFIGTELCVGHNLMFDKMIVHWELFRIGMDKSFPWPPGGTCTAESSSQQRGYRLNLTDLHTELFGFAFDKAHSAGADCEATMKCFVEMVTRGVVVI